MDGLRGGFLKVLVRLGAFLILFPAICTVSPAYAKATGMIMLVSESETNLVNLAVKNVVLPPGVTVDFQTFQALEKNPEARRALEEADIVIVDIMVPQLLEYLDKHVDTSKKRIYALRGSRNDAELMEKGYIFDSEIQTFFHHPTIDNVQNLFQAVVQRELDPSRPYGAPVVRPDRALYHPDHDEPFTSLRDYESWLKESGRLHPGAPWIGVLIYSANLVEGQTEPYDHLIRRMEKEGWNVMAVFGREKAAIEKFFMDDDQKARIDLLLSFSLKFQSSLNDQLFTLLDKLDVPIINVISTYYKTIPEWKKDPEGISPLELTWTICNPEISGLIEPTVLSGKVKLIDPDNGRTYYILKPVKENIELLMPRIRMWVNLRKKTNPEKRVAIFFYNHSQGKQNIGASYLNVFASLETIIKNMKERGYSVESRDDLDQDTIKELILNYARNVGSWAPGELDRMLESDRMIRLPIETYKQWFEKLPEDFKAKVLKDWGPIEESKIMIRDGQFIIPALEMGNLLLLPEPARGFTDAPQKLYHSKTLYPHHQYIAVYLWVKHHYHADAVIHLGTHATHEWLPGKQAGLSASCPPEVLLSDLPNIYPYIVDNIGEGIQAKRRGRGVIIDHMTPAIKEGGLYKEYSRLYDMIMNLNRSEAQAGKTTGIMAEKIMDLVRELGLDKDLNITEPSEEALEKVEHYLVELKENYMPYGFHTFGVSLSGDGLEETTKNILKYNEKTTAAKIGRDLEECGPAELRRLFRALDGRFVPAGEGNDPVRNVEAIPTGRNFYGFDPAKVPSPAAYEYGKRAAEEIIAQSLKTKGRYPEKTAIVLWAVETIRNEGINESTILHLMGLKPKWDAGGRVTGTEVIPGRVLGRPRIDVLINPSGLYRDLFPNMMLYLDKAVQTAAAQTDIDNLIRDHNRTMKALLIENGLPAEQADAMSRIRIFSEKPGSYGNGVSEMVSASGIWESDGEVVDVWENRTGHAYGGGMWGKDARKLLKANLKQVDTALHSISSNLYGTMDNDDMFMYLGGLSMAVKKESGNEPSTLITMQRKPNEVKVEDAAAAVGRELRTRYLNPKWIEGMKEEDYAGARDMAKFVEYLWGWQVTVQSVVDEAKWRQTYEVYVEDKYDLDIKEFFNKENPWAYQSISARMLEAVRKGYWKAPDEVTRKLAAEYAVNVVEKGVACCDHTCNNPLLNQMVVSIISLPGMLSPEMVEKFKIAVEKAAKQKLNEQVEKLRQTQQQLQAGFDAESYGDPRTIQPPPPDAANPPSAQGEAPKAVEGYKMEEVKNQEDDSTEMTSSGVQWYAAAFVLALVALFILGARRQKSKK